MASKATNRRRLAPMIGWREWIALPEFGVAALKAKVDTGAQSSALHAFGLRVEHNEEDEAVAHFEIHPAQRDTNGAVKVSAPIIGWRRVRSSNGEVENRPVIRTNVVIGEIGWAADITLTNRDEMGFRMLLGRSAIRRRFLVDPGRSFLVSRGRRP